MSGINWEKLKTPNMKLAWSLCSVDMSKHFFDAEMVVVPRIDEAPYFDLMVCFSKPNPKNIVKNVKNLITGDTDFTLQGHISDLIKKSTKDEKGTNMKELLSACQNSIKADLARISETYSWENDSGNKSIDITLNNMSKEVINWSTLGEGDLVFDREILDLEGRRTVYVISEVIYAESVSINVSVEGESNAEILDLKIPVAFSYTKFPIDKDGVLKPARDTEIKISATFETASMSED